MSEIAMLRQSTFTRLLRLAEAVAALASTSKITLTVSTPSPLLSGSDRQLVEKSKAYA